MDETHAGLTSGNVINLAIVMKYSVYIKYHTCYKTTAGMAETIN